MTDDERKELEALGVTIYDEPLLTEDGFVNPVFEAGLGAAIEGAWADATARCEADPEWNTPRITYWREVTGYLALWAVRQVQHPDKTPFAPGMENVIGFLSACLRPRFDNLGYAKLSLCDIERMLIDVLWPEKLFQAWNSRDALPGWLDLYALLRNVCTSIRDERRCFDRFNQKFDAEHASYGDGEGI